MKMQRIIKTVIISLFVCMAFSAVSPMAVHVACADAVGNAAGENQNQVTLKKSKGKYYCYQDGKLVKKKWMTIQGKKYYFRKNGEAAVLNTKIGKNYYVFDKKGILVQPKSTKVITIGKKKYQVTSEGKAKKGWSANRKYYFDETGEMIVGTAVLQEKFYVFKANGKYDAKKTKDFQKAAKYKKDFSALKKLIGNPIKETYYSGSCFGDGKDGVLKYKNFTVYTFQYRLTGKVIFMGAE